MKSLALFVSLLIFLPFVYCQSPNTNTNLGSGTSNTTGINNTFIGNESGSSNTTGASNTFVGSQSGAANTAYVNTFVGYRSGESNTTGTANSYLGNISGSNNTTGGYNTFIGNASGLNTIGSNNTFVGASSGENNLTGSGNVFIGNRAGFNETGSSKLYIANSDTSSPIIKGDFVSGDLAMPGSVLIGGNVLVGGTIKQSSDQRFKKNIEPISDALLKVMKLEGVTYELKSDKKNFPSRKLIGVIAQEVEKVVPEVVFTDDNGYKSISYGNLVAISIEAIKTQQTRIELLEEKLNKIETLMAEREAQEE